MCWVCFMVVFNEVLWGFCILLFLFLVFLTGVYGGLIGSCGASSKGFYGSFEGVHRMLLLRPWFG